MLVFTGIIVGGAFLGLIVFGLHKYQSMEVEYTVDRTMPLPPLGEGINSSNLSKISRRRSASAAPSNATATDSQAEPAATAVNQTTWQNLVTAAKQANDLDLALSICQANFPLWGAYNQYCILLRSQLKSSGSAKDEEEAILTELYNAAAKAELLHDKTEGATRYSLNQLRNLPLEELNNIAMPYSSIGYAQLRLIRKSDVKLLVSHWGRPEQHLAPRKFHQEWWDNFSEKHAS